MRGTFDDGSAARLLARVSADATPDGAVLIVGRRDAEILWANAAAHSAPGGLDRARHALFAASPAARAFAARLATMSPAPTPRFERLRIDPVLTTPQIVSCSIVDDELEHLAVLRWDAQIPVVEPPDIDHPVDQVAAEAPDSADRPASPEGPAAPPVRRTRRVLWTADRRGIITQVDPDFVRLAAGRALKVGDHLPTRLGTIDPALGDDVERLLAHGGAFLTSRRDWALDNGAPLAVEIGCARRRGPAGGLGGFCVFHLMNQSGPAAQEGSRPAPSDGDKEKPGGETPGQPSSGAIEPPPAEVRTDPPPPPVAAASPVSNVVHFPAMRIASVPANFGAEMRSAPAIPTPAPEPDLESLVAPRWSETPASGPPAEGLSPDEQDAFTEIGQVLGTKPSARREPEEAVGEPAGQVAPDVAPFLDALPVALVWQIGGMTGANTAFRHRAGFLDGPVPAETVTRDPAGGAAHLLGAGGIIFDAQAVDVAWQGGEASLFVVPQPALPPEHAVTTVSDPGDLAPGIASLDIAADGHATLDDDGTIMQISARSARLFAYEPADLAGRQITDLAMPESRDDWQALLRVEGTDAAARELVGRTRSGHPVPLLVRVGRIAANGLLVSWTDDGERRRAINGLDASRREAERTSALKSELLAKVSHEIRTPLNAILGFAEVIRDERLGPVGNQRYLDYLKDIHESGTHVLSLVNDLLDLSRIEAGRMDLRLEAVDTNAIVAACVSSLQTQAHRERVIVRLSLAPALPAALADERSLRQIVLNLLSNAIKFNEPGGQVIVSTALADHDTIAIRIRDTGIGMTEAEIETAMEPFRQVSAVKRAGSGLGLPVTKALVEANCAVMTIRSTPAQGTLVEVAFPVVEHNSMSLPAE